MIYLDVTDSCQSPMNTGVQRVVRGIFRGLMKSGAPVTPLLWEPAQKCFCKLGPRELEFLTNPFGGEESGRSHGHPQHATALPFLGKLRRWTTRRPKRVAWSACLKPEDTVLLPEIFKDGRCCYLYGPSRGAARCVAVFHDAIAWKLPGMTSPASRKGFDEYVQALSGLEAVLAVSQASADDLRAAWKSKGRSEADIPPITVIGWPLDELFAGTRKETATLKLPNERPKILCVGTLEPRKNHLALLAASEQLWGEGLHFELVLIGRTTAQFGARVVAEVQRLCKAGRPVVWRRHVDDATLLAAYDECAFTVFPSVMEGFGLPIMESLARGRPCICGSKGALGELAGSGCLTVEQTNPAALAGAMMRLLTDAKLHERMSAEARARKFGTWQDYMAKLLPLLSSGGR